VQFWVAGEILSDQKVSSPKKTKKPLAIAGKGVRLNSDQLLIL
jgi:hypothetical protein